MTVIRNTAELAIHNKRTDEVLRDNPAAAKRARDEHQARLSTWQAATPEQQAAFNTMMHLPTEHRCAGCGESFTQSSNETFNQASDRHDDEAYKLHVEMGMPTAPTLDAMDDVEADRD